MLAFVFSDYRLHRCFELRSEISIQVSLPVQLLNARVKIAIFLRQLIGALPDLGYVNSRDILHFRTRDAALCDRARLGQIGVSSALERKYITLSKRIRDRSASGKNGRRVRFVDALDQTSSSLAARSSSTIKSCGVSAGASPSYTFAFVSSLDFSSAILFWQSARRISASASFIFSTSYKWKIVSVANESKYLLS